MKQRATKCRQVAVDAYRVKPGRKLKLHKYPTGVKALYRGEADATAQLAAQVQRTSELQDILYASDRHSLLVIFQAMDAAGKDGAIKHVMSGVNPQGCQVSSFKQPSAEELDHDFLWRTALRLPERGRIGIFNRSYYEEVLVVRVHPQFLAAQKLPDGSAGSKQFWEQRLQSIREHEAHLHRSGTVVSEVLPACLARRAAAAVSGSHRSSGQELEVQSGRCRRAPVLGRIHECLREGAVRNQARGTRPGMWCRRTTRRTPV